MHHTLDDDPQWQALLADHRAQNRRDRMVLALMVVGLAAMLPEIPAMVILFGPVDIYIAVMLMRGRRGMERNLREAAKMRGEMDSVLNSLRQAVL